MGFKRYVIKRFLLLIPILFGVSVVSFSIIHLVPGGPVAAALGTRGDEELIEEMRRQYGLNRPLYIQYLDWVTSAIQGDFGTSIRTERDVSEAVASHTPPTFWIAISATLISILIGIPTGIISAVNHYSTKDYVATFFAFVGLSIPNFFLGLVLILVFGLYLSLFPTSGYTDPLTHPVEGVRRLILPAFTIGTALSAVVMRMMRSSLLEVFSEEYIRTARAKGLTRRLVTNKHAVKNALIPTITVIGLNFGYVLGGVVIVEQIFAIPGLGRLTLQAIFNREYSVIQASLLLIAFMFSLVNLATDIVYAYLDPRIKYS